jgi:hypothetical protein
LIFGAAGSCGAGVAACWQALSAMLAMINTYTTR